MKTYKVEYWVGTYHGFVNVTTDADDTDVIIAKAKKILYKNGHPGMVYEMWGIENRSELHQ